MRFSFGVATLVAQSELFFAALYLRSRSARRFDMTVAAETLVALGVFSLITGIVLAVLAAPGLQITAGNSAPADFEPLLIPFAEGLFASAVAPLLATLLRQIEVLKYPSHSEGVSSGEHLDHLKHEIESAVKALSQLRIETEAATKNTASFAKAAKSILESLNDLAANIKDAKGIIPTTLSLVAREIGTAGPSVTAALNTTADNISTASGRVAAGLAGASSSLDNFTTKLVSGTETTKQMTEELGRLSKDAHATTGILKRLQELIESVTNFIRPEKP